MPTSPAPIRPKYTTSVFINCPFEPPDVPPGAPPSYNPLFRALVFTVEYCGFSARCALEVDDSGESRAGKIVRIIRESRLGIHDISRTESNAAGLPRFNMPYEFGIFAGFKYSGRGAQGRKALLVLDREPHRYHQFLSDIAGQDIKSHGGEPERLVTVVRGWLQAQTTRPLPGAKYLVEQFNRFRGDLPDLLQAGGLTDADLETYTDYYRFVGDWIRANTAAGAG